MDYLPIFMNMRERRAVIVGGGVVASRKASLVARTGAIITVISVEVSPAMRVVLRDERHRWIARAFSDDDLAEASLVIAATDDADANRRVYDVATRSGIPVNVVDCPSLCSFIVPAIVDRSPVVVAVSTGGRSPVLARHIKSQLERFLPARLGRLAEICGRYRQRLVEAIASPGRRRRTWESLFEGRLPELVFAGQDAEAAAVIEAGLESGDATEPVRGAVYLIGAGPGDPELLTLKAQRLLQRADVVLYDRLVPVGVLDMCRRDAEMIYVGKRCNDHTIAQCEISELLVEHARQGRRVARLKGGDPFVFGRGGEELEALVDAGIEFEVVPGISAANGSAAYAGIPLTHRDHAQSVSFCTGHTQNGVLDADWKKLCASRNTLVFFMAAANGDLISRKLIEHGLPATMPVAIVQAATTPRQTVRRTSLHALRRDLRGLDRSLPTLIIVGTVVNLATDLGWYRGDPQSGEAVFPPHLGASSAARRDDAA